MSAVYGEVRTPYKYGVVLRADPTSKATMVDSPSVFRHGGRWYLVYIHFIPEVGYETLLACSDDLLTWEPLGTLLSLEASRDWDRSQVAGYIALQDTRWGGTARLHPYAGRYWMSYLGGPNTGYETYPLSIGLASTRAGLPLAQEWSRLSEPVLTPLDPDIRNESRNLFKSNIIEDRQRLTGARFAMYYNAAGSDGVERIFMAVSDDMLTWRRYGDGPVVDNGAGISGDPQVVQIGDVWVMFYFGAFYRPGAFDTFACSYDLVNWTTWDGPDLMAPSEAWDATYAHKPWVMKHDGIVYHYYTAVGSEGRVIAVATSEDLRPPVPLRVTASYTFYLDSVAPVSDGVISNDEDPRNRWTAYRSPSAADWVQFEWDHVKRLTGVRLFVYDDGGGVQPPARYDVEVLDNGMWRPVTGLTASPEVPTAELNTATFDAVETTAARVVLVHRGGGVYAGLTELEWIEG